MRMITILSIMQYQKDESDLPWGLYLNGRGQSVDYQRDRPPIELIKIPKSIIEQLCPSFSSRIVKGIDKEIVLTDEDVKIFCTELKDAVGKGNSEAISREILKFVDRYEQIKENYHLAYQGNDL
jgi:hypothetical protein